MKILVVEDDQKTRDEIVNDLIDKGYDVMHAENGLEALKLISNHRFDLLITDLNMPYLDGYGLAEATGGIPPMFIYTSGSSLGGIDEVLKRKGTQFSTFLVRATPEKILDLVMKMLTVSVEKNTKVANSI